MLSREGTSYVGHNFIVQLLDFASCNFSFLPKIKLQFKVTMTQHASGEYFTC